MKVFLKLHKEINRGKQFVNNVFADFSNKMLSKDTVSMLR